MGVIVARAPVRSQLPQSVTTTECYPAVSLSSSALIGNTVDVDALPLSSFIGALWQVVCINNTSGTVHTFTVYGTHDTRGTASFVVYAIKGDSSIATANVTVDGTFLTLKVQNNSPSTIQIFATRTAIPTTKAISNALPVVEVSRLRSYVRPLSTATVDFIEQGLYQAVTWVVTLTDATGNLTTASVFVNLETTDASIAFISGTGRAEFDLVITDVVGVGTELSVVSTSTNGYAISVTKIPVGPQKATVNVCGTVDGLGFQILPSISLLPVVAVTADEITFASSKGVQWLATFTGANAHMATIITSSVEVGSEPVVSPIIGNLIDVDITHDNTPGIMRLRFRNNTLLPITANLLRVPVAV